jgi:heme/copper-type cytochrome/quinol oxidase subunit 3
MTDAAIQSDPRPIGSVERRTSGWYGMLTVLMTEGALFAYLLFSYYYFAVQYGHQWLPDLPKLHLSLPNTIILFASSVAAWFAQRGVRIGRKDHLVWGLVASIVLGAIFMLIQGLEWGEKPFTMASAAYGSVYFTITGFHMMHVAAGLIFLVLLLIWSWLDYFDRERRAPLAIGIVYWHFVNAVWLALFFTFYITPRLG